jgi:hypothetical protein
MAASPWRNSFVIVFVGTGGTTDTDPAVERGGNGGVGAGKGAVGMVEGAVGVAEGTGVVVGADDASESWGDFSSEFGYLFLAKEKPTLEPMTLCSWNSAASALTSPFWAACSQAWTVSGGAFSTS